MKAKVEPWGKYLRYNYVVADFSSVKDPGLYFIQYGTQKTGAFPIATDVYERVWHPTLDVFFPVQMDHMFVNEGYRVWHGAAHLDDAVQAPLERAALRRLPDGRDDQHARTSRASGSRAWRWAAGSTRATSTSRAGRTR